MSYSNLENAIKMCGSVKNFLKTIEPYSSIAPPEIIAHAKASNWDKEAWIQVLKTQNDSIEHENEADIVLFHHPDIRSLLKGKLQFSKPIPVTAEISIQAESGIQLKMSLNNPYVKAQATNVASFSTFITNVTAVYAKINAAHPDENDEDAEKKIAKYNSKAEAAINQVIVSEINNARLRGFQTYQREMDLPKIVRLRHRDRWVNGTVSVLTAVFSVGTAVFTTASAVFSFGGTAVAAGLAIHSAVLSIVNTGIELRKLGLHFKEFGHTVFNWFCCSNSV